MVVVSSVFKRRPSVDHPACATRQDGSVIFVTHRPAPLLQCPPEIHQVAKSARTQVSGSKGEPERSFEPGQPITAAASELSARSRQFKSRELELPGRGQAAGAPRGRHQDRGDTPLPNICSKDWRHSGQSSRTCRGASTSGAQKLLIDFPCISVSPMYNFGSLLGLGLFSQAAAARVVSPTDLIRAALCSERIIRVR
jgi:hypothetical protein